MKRWFIVPVLIVLPALALIAQTNWEFLSPLRNAQFVYVTSYSGTQFSANPLPEDRAAIGAVQTALQNLQYTVVYHPEKADMIVAVERRPSEDVLAVYSRESLRNGAYLWRATAKHGLSSPNLPLMQELRTALAKANGTIPG
jgi:hypothetical protein